MSSRKPLIDSWSILLLTNTVSNFSNPSQGHENRIIIWDSFKWKSSCINKQKVVLFRFLLFWIYEKHKYLINVYDMYMFWYDLPKLEIFLFHIFWKFWEANSLNIQRFRSCYHYLTLTFVTPLISKLERYSSKWKGVAKINQSTL